MLSVGGTVSRRCEVPCWLEIRSEGTQREEVSMKVAIQFEAQLRQVAGTGNVDIDVPEGINLLSALKQIASSSNEGLRERLLTEEGELQASVLVFVNDQPVPSQSADVHGLNADDTILLLPPISGG